MIILLDTIILVLIYIAFCIVLNMFNLVFRKWVLILFLLMLATGFIAGSDTTSFENQEIGTKERSNLYIRDFSISIRKCNNPYDHICLCE